VIRSGFIDHSRTPGGPHRPAAEVQTHARRDFEALTEVEAQTPVFPVVAHRRSTGHDEMIREYLIPTAEEAGLRTVGICTTDPTENAYQALAVRPSKRLGVDRGGRRHGCARRRSRADIDRVTRTEPPRDVGRPG
jgi:hypothetical protein